VLAVEGNRIRLSRKAILKEQRAKMGGGDIGAEGGDGHGGEGSGEGTRAPALTIEGGGDFPDEPDFNREPAPTGDRGPGGRDPNRGGRPGGGGGAGGRRRPGRGGRGGGGGHGGGGHRGGRH
jgi:polyribonucleotide nucleotidyltransferase